ncbi:DUF4321 domain-containing protein [Thermosyntropha lipolytica]|uniref:DUF4321 domain-containing protein n=1 Tax=Thermosyntropha lipolytica TaxID=54294 RepID=UPI001FA8B662|nr:DUF4321 domain-containing protein [Thermosyntropha lipolytica]
MARSRSYPGWQVLLLLVILGGIVGGWIGNAIIKLWPALSFLGTNQSLGIPGFTVDLQVLTFTFGFMLNINLFTLLGFVLAYILYRKI